MSISAHPFRQRGVTLIEQIVFIIVVSVGVVGVLSTLGPSLRYSADPQLRKQKLAIAESLLAEILHQPFTYCDPDDPAAVSATSALGCGVSQDSVAGPSPATEDRFGLLGQQFDNVADYANYSQIGVVTNILNNLSGSGAVARHDVKVTITQVGVTFGLSPTEVLEVAVTVTGGDSEDLTLRGHRFRYAPRY